jgi:hypothetical protein
MSENKIQDAWRDYLESGQDVWDRDRDAFQAGYNAAQPKPCWTPVSEGLPTEGGWYLVSVREHNDLGTFDYTDIVSWGNRAEVGDTWFVQSDKVTVMAWQPRPEPYCGGKIDNPK